ncbi:MAG: hypothetical protein IKF17_02885 [Clostridia bacterium]|nr:hypothetical protein [Clostridia bacterium]
MKKVLKIISLVLIIITIFIGYLILLKSIRIKILEKNAEIKVKVVYNKISVSPDSMQEENLNNAELCYFLDIDRRTLYRVDYYKIGFIKNYKIFKAEVSQQDIKNTIDYIEKSKNTEIRRKRGFRASTKIIAVYNDEEIYLNSLPFSY